MIRVAAVGDLHYDRRSRPELKRYFSTLSARADLLLIAGDLTQSGSVEEARALAADLEGVSAPVILVLGNHDFHQNQDREILELFRRRGIKALEGDSLVLELHGIRVGVVGLKGFGGGFFGACITDFGEPETKQFARHARVQADLLCEKLQALDTEFKFALLHFSPIEGTLLGEKREIYPFLGSYLLAEALDAAGADAAFHGHAHHGVERGATPGGIPVRNVALTVIRHAYNVYSFDMPRRTQERPRELHAAT
ncbi:MAG: metallophosphoesterase [Oligoflexia bacterium]|nr:metallophosphoesterase [Oligoflexia bacterium]